MAAPPSLDVSASLEEQLDQASPDLLRAPVHVSERARLIR
jgi:hypothetical protein